MNENTAIIEAGTQYRHSVDGSTLTATADIPVRIIGTVPGFVVCKPLRMNPAYEIVIYIEDNEVVVETE